LSHQAAHRKDRAGAAALKRTMEILVAADSVRQSFGLPHSLGFSEIRTSEGVVQLHTDVGWISICPGESGEPTIALLHRKSIAGGADVHRITARSLARAKNDFVAF
jgi:hypothetical protein